MERGALREWGAQGSCFFLELYVWEVACEK
jgi:hypothetical protein